MWNMIGKIRPGGWLKVRRLVENTDRIGYNPIFDSKRAEMPLFLGIIRSFDLAKM